MMDRKILSIIFCLFLTAEVSGQWGSSAVPFLSIPVNTQSIGRGGMTTADFSSTPSTVLGNPAHVGFLSRTSTFAFESFLTDAQWQVYSLSNRGTMSLTSAAAGYSFPSFSLGIGYTAVSLSYGNVTLTHSTQSGVWKTFSPRDWSENLSVGIGTSVLGIDVALGLTMKQIASRFVLPTAVGLSEIEPKKNAFDAGFLLDVPIFTQPSTSLHAHVRLRVGYAVTNIGGDFSYSTRQSDPLAVTAKLAWTLIAGSTIIVDKHPTELVTIAGGLEAEEFLFSRNSDGTHFYQYRPIDDMNPFKSLVLGKYYDFIPLRSGLTLRLLNTFALSVGRHQYFQTEYYTTRGLTFSTDGMIFLLDSPSEHHHSPVGEILFHRLSIHVSHSVTTNPDNYPGGNTFTGVTVTLRH